MKFFKKFSAYFINDNRKPGGRKGSILRHGRFNVRFGEWLNFHWTWYLWSSFCSADIGVSSDGGITLHASMPPVAFWFAFDWKPLRWFHHKFDWYELGWSIHSWALWVSLWCEYTSHDFTVSFWHRHRRRFNINFLDVLLGRSKHTEREISIEELMIPMLEDNYLATCKIFESTWKRPRWFARRMIRSTIELEDPIPFPGKGESDYDCGMDGIHGQTAAYDNVPAAVASIVETVLKNRRERGGVHWQPPVRDLAG